MNWSKGHPNGVKKIIFLVLFSSLLSFPTFSFAAIDGTNLLNDFACQITLTLPFLNSSDCSGQTSSPVVSGPSLPAYNSITASLHPAHPVAQKSTDTSKASVATALQGLSQDFVLDFSAGSSNIKDMVNSGAVGLETNASVIANNVSLLTSNVTANSLSAVDNLKCFFGKALPFISTPKNCTQEIPVPVVVKQNIPTEVVTTTTTTSTPAPTVLPQTPKVLTTTIVKEPQVTQNNYPLTVTYNGVSENELTQKLGSLANTLRAERRAQSDAAAGAFSQAVYNVTNVSSGSISSVSNSDGTLTLSPTTGAVVASLNLANQNLWSGLQTFNKFVSTSSTSTNATSTNFAATTICLTGDTCRTTWPSGGGISGILAQYSTVQGGATQTFATTTDPNIALTITSASNTHTFAPSWVGTLASGRGGTGLGTVVANQLLVGNTLGTGWTQISTSTLGLLTTNVAEGSNLYYTQGRFDAALSATTTLPKLTTLLGLTDTITTRATTTNATSTNFAATTICFTGDICRTTWPSGGAGGITSLNGLTVSTQTFATSTNNGGWGFSSNTTTHTLNIPTASASNPLGLLSNTDWTTFNGKLSAAVTSLAQTYGSAQTGAVTLATSTTAINNDWGVTNSGGTFTFNLPTATASVRGLLSGADWTTFNGKQAAGSYITALTGDVSASGPGSAGATLATVNTNTGSFGSSTAIPNFTVNGKGLITAAGTSAVVAPAGTLTGTTLASNVVTSSLTSIGTLLSGAVPASLITSGAFGSGNYTFPGTLGITSGLTTLSNLLLNSSSTLQNFTFANATGTQATTTNLFSTNGTFTNLFAPNLSNLTTNGFVKTSGGNGALSVDTSTYLTSAVTSLNGLTTASQSFATTTNNGGWGFSSNTSTHTLNIPTASASNPLGLLSSTDWTTFNNKGSGTVTSVTGTYPIQSTGGATPVLSLAFGTTTNNLWSGTNIFQNASTTIVGGLTVGGSSTTTNATSTGAFNVGGLFNATGALSTLSNLYVTGSSTLQAFTATNSTTTSATTTNFFATTASTTNHYSASYFGAQLSNCNSASNALTYTSSSGTFGCNTISSGGGSGNSKWATSTDNTSIYLNAATKVGIGTTSPLNLLDVSASDSGTTVTNSSNALISIVNTNTTANNFAGLNFTTVDSVGNTVNASKIIGVFTNHTTGAVSSDLAFLNTNAGTFTENMRLTAAGLLGIGSSTPWGKLSAEMTTKNPTFVVSHNGSSTPAFYIGGVNENGLIGINTSSPAAGLQINWDATSSTATTTSTLLRATTPVFRLGTPVLSSPNINGTFIGLNTLSTFSGDLVNLQVNGATKFKIDGSGGITMGSISSIAGISSTISSTGYRVYRPGGSVILSNNGDSGISTAGIETGAAGSVGTPSDYIFLAVGNAGNGTSAADQFRLYGTGYSGFGTTTPQWQLELATTSNSTIARPQLTLTDTANNSHWSFRNAGGILYIATSSPSTFATSSQTAFWLDTNGFMNTGSIINCNGVSSALGVTNNQIQCDTGVSDLRLKRDITSLSNSQALNDVMKLKPVSFYFKDNSLPNTHAPEEQFGFLAQDVQAIFPNLVGTTSPTYLTPDVTLTLNKDGLIAQIVSAVQQLNIKVDSNASSSAASLSTITSAIGLNLNDALAGLDITRDLVLHGGLKVDSVSSISDLLSLQSDTEFIGRPYFNSDTGGIAVIHKGSRQVDVTFDRSYSEAPVVSASITLDASSTDAQAATILADTSVRSIVANRSGIGFTLLLAAPAPEDIKFSWIALAIKNMKIFDSVNTPQPTSSVTNITPPTTTTNFSSPTSSSTSSTTPSLTQGTTTGTTTPLIVNTTSATTTSPVSTTTTPVVNPTPIVNPVVQAATSTPPTPPITSASSTPVNASV